MNSAPPTAPVTGFQSPIRHWPLAIWLLALATGWLVGGCASSSDPASASAPRPGSGIAEYRTVTREAHRAVGATVKSLEALAHSPIQPSLQHPALPGFDRALHDLELASIKTRARAEAIIIRGQAYFDEWKGNLAVSTNQAAVQAEQERYSRLHERFALVRQRSGEVREEFRPFMARLRELRAGLDKPAPAAGGQTPRPDLDGAIASGRRVLTALESVSVAVNEAEAELRTTLAARR